MTSGGGGGGGPAIHFGPALGRTAGSRPPRLHRGTRLSQPRGSSSPKKLSSLGSTEEAGIAAPAKSMCRPRNQRSCRHLAPCSSSRLADLPIDREHIGAGSSRSLPISSSIRSESSWLQGLARTSAIILDRLAEGIAPVRDHFDVVILDPPPALGAVSLSVMHAARHAMQADPPTVIDFTSTTSFLAKLHETIQTSLQERRLRDLEADGEALVDQKPHDTAIGSSRRRPRRTGC